MRNEGATVPCVGLLEPGDGVLGYVDGRLHVLFLVLAAKSVVRLPPYLLQGGEHIGEAAHLWWKRGHRPFVLTCCPRLAVLKRAVRLMLC